MAKRSKDWNESLAADLRDDSFAHDSGGRHAA